MKKRRCFSRLIAVIVLALFPGEWALSAAILPAGFTETQFGSNLGSNPTAMDYSRDETTGPASVWSNSTTARRLPDEA
jgi:hypothetical protein